MFRLLALSLLWVLAIQIQPAHAALIISVVPSSGTYVAGSAGFADVFIHSTSNDELDSFLFDLNVGGGSGVTFASPQTENFLTDASYVFNNRSANVAFNLPATIVSNGGATLTMADVSYDFLSPPNSLPRAIPDASNPLLLGRFEFVANLPGNYTLTLDPASSFSDVTFNTIAYSSTGASFSVTAVPEPGSLALMALTGTGAIWLRRKLQRKPQRGTSDGTDPRE